MRNLVPILDTNLWITYTNTIVPILLNISSLHLKLAHVCQAIKIDISL